MTNDWNMVMHLAEAAAMIIFGVGAWSAQRKANETTNATDITALKQKVDGLICWDDFDRLLETERLLTAKDLENIRERLGRIEKRVFNGGHHV